MSRRVKLPTLEKGEVQLLLLNGWEKEWAILRDTAFGNLFSVVPHAAVEHALRRLSRPLVDALGIPPEGALRKVPKVSRECLLRRKRTGHRPCPFYDRNQCFPIATKMPWCFEPDGIEDEKIRKMAAQAIELWREGVYVVVVMRGGS